VDLLRVQARRLLLLGKPVRRLTALIVGRILSGLSAGLMTGTATEPFHHPYPSAGTLYDYYFHIAPQVVRRPGPGSRHARG
jgi:hypothetical protein